MYTPAYSKVDDPALVAEVMRRHGFATLVTSGESGLVATHLPFLFDPGAPGTTGVLRSHMARANPQWRDFEAAGEVMVVFQGEHGYISPSWYGAPAGQPNVPTWNYEAVHAYGVPRILGDADAGDLLVRTARHYEGDGSAYAVPDDFLRRNVQGIVAFEIQVGRIEGKFKLSQNRSADEVRRLVAVLEKGGEGASHRLAAAMRRANGLGTA